MKKSLRLLLEFVFLGTIVILQGSGIRGQKRTTLNDSPIPTLSHSANPSSPAKSREGQLGERYGKLPLSFEENQGQVYEKVKFLSRGSGYTLFLTPTEAVLTLSAQSAKNEDRRATRTARRSPRTRRTVLRMKLVGANPLAQVAGLEELPGKSNYFIGSDSSKWRTNINTYAKVKYREVYPGIDLVYYGNQRQLEYDWIVSPGAKTEDIRFAIEGAKTTSIDLNGDLVLAVTGGDVRLHKPVVYQETDGVRHNVVGSYVKKTNQEIGFRLAEYDPAKPLVIDPVLVYSTYLGGSEDDRGYAIAVDSSGNAYVTGYTISTNFPTANALQPSLGVGGFELGGDAFVTKFNATGSALVYSTYLGGNELDWGHGIAVDSSGNAYVTGVTNSTNFPAANPVRPASSGLMMDAFVTKINSTGSALIYSSHLGGNRFDSGDGIAVDSSGNAYITGITESTNFPTANPLQPTYGGNQDAFVTKFNATGSALVYSTYLGGSDVDSVGGGIAVDSSGNAYGAGGTYSTNFPTANAIQPIRGGPGLFPSDAFVTKFNPSGTALVYSTYLGGNEAEFGARIAVDSSGNAYVTGSTNSTNFPTANAIQPTLRGGPGIYPDDAFVTKFNPSGTALVYSTYHGGSGGVEMGFGIAVDSSGNAYVTGCTDSTDFPTANALQPAYGGGHIDAFLTKFNSSGSALVYSTYLGGNELDQGFGIAVDSSGNAYLTGHTDSTNFPTVNPRQPAYGGGYHDAFITKIDFSLPNPVPILKITMSKAIYVDGETVTTSDFRAQNPAPSPVPVKLRIWVSIPGMGEFTCLAIGEDGSFALPANLDQNLGPVTLFVVTQAFPPKGNWQFNSRMENPATGALLSEDINPFVIQ